MNKLVKQSSVEFEKWFAKEAEAQAEIAIERRDQRRQA